MVLNASPITRTTRSYSIWQEPASLMELHRRRWLGTLTLKSQFLYESKSKISQVCTKLTMWLTLYSKWLLHTQYSISLGSISWNYPSVSRGSFVVLLRKLVVIESKTHSPCPSEIVGVQNWQHLATATTLCGIGLLQADALPNQT